MCKCMNKNVIKYLEQRVGGIMCSWLREQEYDGIKML